VSWIADGALFLCGAYLCMRTLAAVYRILDLWYTIGTAYPRVVRGLLGWGGASAASVAFAGNRHRGALVGGLLAFLIFHFSLYALRHLVVRKPSPLE
jgi:hypothetical protein